MAVSLDIQMTIATEGLLGLAVHAAGGQPSWAAGVPAAVERAVGAVGDTTGELWLHLLGLATDLPDPDAPEALLERVDGMRPSDLMRQVVGVQVPAWRDCVAIEDLEAAARGDADAALRLLTSPRYYAGRAAQALPRVLELGPPAAADRIRTALRAWFSDVVEPAQEEIQQLHRRASSLAAPIAGESAVETVERLAGGLRLEPEPYTNRIVLVPQFAQAGWQVLAQHDDARIVLYDGARTRPTDLEEAAGVFSALGESTRIEMLRCLANRPGGVSDLARETGLAKSTVHQHLAVLREAGLIRLAGQAWKYRYEVLPERIAHASETITKYLASESRNR